MGKFLRTLAKVGLVELDEAAQAAEAGAIDESELDELIAQAAGDSAPAPSEPAPAPTPPPVPLPEGADASAFEVVEGRPFEAMYELAEIPASPYSAEKLLRLLDGLKAMEAPVRLAAVKAMDEADDAWTVDDAVLDAQRKIRALDDAGGTLDARMQGAEQNAERELAARDDYQAKAAASIRKQIADLEKMLEEELAKVAEEKAAINAALAGTRSAWQREKARLATERERLSTLPTMFAPPPADEPAA